jgi:hypothetical protein
MLPALPDLSYPLAGVPGTAYRGFDRDGLVVAVPDRLRLEAEPDGRPRLLLTLLRSGGVAASSGGRLELGLSIESDVEGIGRALAAQGTPVSLVVADVEDGVLTLEAVLGPLTPTLLAPPQMLPPDLLTRARVVVELSAEAAGIAARLIEDAMLPLEATMRLAFRAVAPRLPLAATYNPRAVAERLAARLGEGKVVTMADFESAIEALLTGPEVVVAGDLQAIDPQLWARTAALRLRDRFAARATSEPGKLQLLSLQSVPSGREQIDFAAPAAVVVEQTMSIEPLSTVRSMRHGVIDDVVKRLDLPPLPTGRQRLDLSANLPEPIAGLQALVADFRAPELPPFRPLAVSLSVSLDAPERRAAAELRLAPGEQLAGEVRLRAIIARNGQAVEIAGPWRAIQRADVLLGPADFGAPLLVLRASPVLTALAVVEAVAAGTVVARLDTATRMTAIPLTEQDLRILARPLAEGHEIAIELGEKKRLDLDVATLPGFGAHRAQFVTAETQPFIVEWQADGETGQEPLSVRMGADRTVAEIGWIAVSPFRPGVIWRTVRDGTPGPWSAPVLPQDGLVIRIEGRTPMDDREKPIIIDGVKIAAKNGDGRAWSYVPPRPELERGPGGAPMLTVIEAGATAFLQCTARVALHEEARRALLARLKEIKPKAETLEPAPLSVERIALEVKTGSTWVVVTESKSSGMPPWTAALAATLAPDPLAAIKSALAGEKERARLRAWIVLPGSPAAFRRSTAAGEVRLETPTGAASARFAATADASSAAGAATALELGVDLADFFPAGESKR